MYNGNMNNEEQKEGKGLSYSYKKYKNIDKHVRLALATKFHEQRVHMEKANKFAVRYGVPKPFPELA